MGKKKKDRKLRRHKLKKLEERSDRRTAEFLVRSIEGIETALGDLIPDLQTFEHYCEIQQVSFCLRLIGEMKKKYEKQAEGASWRDSD